MADLGQLMSQPQVNLADMGGMNFDQFAAARDQVALAQQSAQANIDAQNEANAQQAQLDPIAVQQAAENLTKSQQANQLGALDVDTATSNHDVDKEAARQKQITAMSDEELKQFSNKAQLEAMDPDPTISQRGQNKLQYSLAAIQQRQKAADSLNQATATMQGKIGIAQIMANSRDTDAATRAASIIQVAQIHSQDVAQKIAYAVQNPASTDKVAASLYTQYLQETDPAKKADLWAGVNAANQMLAARNPNSQQIDTSAVAGFDKLPAPQVAAPGTTAPPRLPVTAAPVNASPAPGALPAPAGGPVNNPGNLRPVGASTGFQQFDSPQAGLQAVDQNLQAYGAKGINTISGIINRWAPPSDNNNTPAYIADVSKRLGIDPNQPVDMSNPVVRQAIGTAIVLHEQGPARVFGQAQPQQQPQQAAPQQVAQAQQAPASSPANTPSPSTNAAAAGQVKVTKDGKSYMLPANQLSKALAQGYTQAK